MDVRVVGDLISIDILYIEGDQYFLPCVDLMLTLILMLIFQCPLQCYSQYLFQVINTFFLVWIMVIVLSKLRSRTALDHDRRHYKAAKALVTLCT